MKIKKLKLKKNSNNEYSDYYFIPKNENIKCADGNSLESIIYDLKSKIDTLTNKTNDLIKNAPLIGVTEGTNLNIKDSAESNIKKLGIYGNSYQKTYDGYQLLNVSDHTLTSRGITTITKDNKINCSGITDTNWANISASSAITCDLKANKTYTFVLNKTLSYELDFKYNSKIDIRIPAGSIYTTYTPTAEKTGLYYFIQAKEGTSINITDLQLMIYEGEYDENKTFEPYTGETSSPNPDYPQDIEVINNGWNLFDGRWKIGTIRATDGSDDDANTKRLKTIDYIKVEPITNYVYSLGGNYTYGIVFEYDKNKNFIKTSSWQTIPYKFVTENTTRFIRLVFQNNDEIMSLDDIEWCQINKGTEPKPYLPYGHIGLLQRGKNKIYSLTKIGNIYYVNEARSSTNFIFQPGTYTLSYKSQSDVSVYIQEKDKTLVSKGQNKTITFTTTDIFNFWFYRSGMVEGEIIDVQLEESSTPTPYEPYHEPKLYGIDLAGNSIAKVEDVKDLLSISEKGKVELEKNIGYKVLDGSEEWGTQNTCYVYNGLMDIKQTPAYEDRGQYLIISNYYITQGSDYRLSIKDLCISKVIDSANTKQIAIKNTNIASVAEFKTWLSTHNTKVHYVLAIPQKLTLPTTEPIKMWEGTNIFEPITNLEPNNMKIVYRKDINSIIKESGV